MSSTNGNCRGAREREEGEEKRRGEKREKRAIIIVGR